MYTLTHSVHVLKVEISMQLGQIASHILIHEC